MDRVPHEPASDEAALLVEGPGDEAPVKIGHPIPEADLVVQGPLGVQAQDVVNNLDGLIRWGPFEKVVATERERCCLFGGYLNGQRWAPPSSFTRMLTSYFIITLTSLI